MEVNKHKTQKDPAVADFKKLRIPKNAQRIIELVNVSGGDYNKVDGLSHALYQEALALMKRNEKVGKAYQAWKQEPNCNNARKVVELINKSGPMSSDYGIPNQTFIEIQKKALSKKSSRRELIVLPL